MTKDNIDSELDKLFNAIENMIDTQDDIWHEEQHENRREVNRLKEEIYTPAKQKARDAFETAVREIVKKMFKNRVSHNL